MKPTYDKYKEIKEKYSARMILMRCGNFYETYDDDAKNCARVLGLTLCMRGEGCMCGFPFHQLDTYLPKLVRAGFVIAIEDGAENTDADLVTFGNSLFIDDCPIDLVNGIAQVYITRRPLENCDGYKKVTYSTDHGVLTITNEHGEDIFVSTNFNLTIY